MPADDKQALWREYAKTRDEAVRDRLILTYAPLVMYVAGLASLWAGSRTPISFR